MAETVGQHSVAAFTSPVNGTTPIDANSVRGNDNTVRSAYVDHDADPGIHVQSSTLASRPVAGTAGRKWITVSSGRYQLWYDDGSRWHEVASDAINVDCLADANLAKGDVVKVTGFNNGQNLPTVNKVTSSTDVAFGVVENTVTSGNIVQIVNTGLIEDVDTNGYAVGTILYPNTSGGWTTTKPTSGNYQPAGFVLRGNSSNGVLYAEFSAPRIVERSDNTASTIVLRDASGNFAAGTITAGAVTSTGLVTFASLKGTGATTVTNILDEDNMASDSATALATQQSIKAYVDAQVATVDTLAEVLANGNTTGATDIIVTAGQKVTTDTIAETTAAAGVTIDSVLLKDDVVNATDIEVDTISANNGTLAVTLASTGVATIAQQPILSSLTASQAVFTDSSKGLVSNAITGSGNVVMSASPTLTGTVTAATINATTLGGTLSTAAQTNITSVGTLTGLTVTNPITGSVTGSSGSTTGNAATATALQTARNINGVSFNGTADITVTAAAGTLTGTTLASGVTASSLTSVGTLTSLTVSGDLAVDTNTLYVDAANNRVGVGTASPGAILDIRQSTSGGVGPTLSLINSAATASGNAVDINMAGNPGGGALAPTARIRVTEDGTAKSTMTFWTYDGSSLATRATIDPSGNLGLGVTPSYKLHVVNDTAATNSAVDVLALTQSTTGTAASGLGAGILFNSERPSGGIILKRGAIYGVAGTNADDNGDLAFYTLTNTGASGFSEKMRLDASGNLGVGTTSPATRLDVAQTNAKSATAVWQIQTFDTTSATTGVGGGISFGGYKTSNTAAEVFAAIDGYKENATGGNAAGALRFHTQVSGGTGVVERARITSGGDVQIRTADAYLYSNGTSGGTTIDAGFRFLSSSKVLSFWTNDTERARITSGGYFKASDAGTYISSTGPYHEFNQSANDDGLNINATNASYSNRVLLVRATRNTTDASFYFIGCYNSTATAFKMYVADSGTVTNSTGTYGTISDAKLKQDVIDAPSQWDDLKAIRFRKYRMKSDVAANPNAPYLLGVVAQELQAVSPGLIEAHKDTEEVEVTDEDGNVTTETRPTGTETLSVKSSILLMKAAVALQEAMARIEALEARLEALEA